MPRIVDNPKPVPLPTGLVVKNGSNIRSRISFGIPLPVSVIERKDLLVLGMMFKLDPLFISRDVDEVSVLRERFFSLKEQDFSSLQVQKDDLDRMGFELKFQQKGLLRNFTITIDRKKEGNNEAVIKLDSRFDKKITGKIIQIDSDNDFRSFFKEDALSYFMNSIVNGIAIDIFKFKMEGKQNGR